MKQDTFTVVPSTASQVGHSRRLIQISRRIGIVLAVAAVLLVMVGAFTTPPSAHASGCSSSNTWATQGAIKEGQNPVLYRNSTGGGPKLGVLLNSCEKQFTLKWSRTICFDYGCEDVYYQVYWKRPGYDTWQQFTADNSSSTQYKITTFKNVHLGTYYNFAVRSCHSNARGCNGTWSPTVGIYT
jgi:hypothetical protein